MSYPDFAQSASSKIEVLSEVVFDRATNGKLRARSMWPAQKHTFVVEHDLTTAQVATLRTFYANNIATVIPFVWQGDQQTYSVVMKSMSDFVPIGKDGWKVTVRLEEA